MEKLAYDSNLDSCSLILDKSKQNDMSKNELESLLNYVKVNQSIGDVIWASDKHENYFRSAAIDSDTKLLMNQIEEKIIENNENYQRFPNDYVHCLMSNHVYREDLKEGEIINVDGNVWEVIKCYNEPPPVLYDEKASTKAVAIKDTKSKKENKVPPFYVGALFMNKQKKQMILAHKGIDADISSFFNSSGQINQNIKGILINEIVPQLQICYEVTKEANNMAKEKNCYLSFTGYSHGAWLGEYSIYYSYRYFSNPKTKAVLFESPGIVKNEEQIKSNVISVDTQFDLRDLNIVNYLTAPKFSNSCNKHVGKVYRMFISEDIPILFHDNLKKLPLIGNKIYEKLKSANFFLNGLYSMFSHENLFRILSRFNKRTGRPYQYEQVINWPIIEMSIDKNYEENLKNMIEEPTERFFRIIPVPNIIKYPSAFVLKKLLSNVTNILMENAMPGLHLLINIMIEISKENINLQQLDDPSFYKVTDKDEQIAVRENFNNNNENEDSSGSQSGFNFKVKKNEFKLKFNNSYETKKVDESKEELRICSDKKNIDWCLSQLKEAVIEVNQPSKLVYKQLMNLNSSFTIEINNLYVDREIKIIQSNSKLVTIEMLRERLIRLISIYPNIRILLMKQKHMTNNIDRLNKEKIKLEIPTHNLSNRIKFIGRVDCIKKIAEHLAKYQICVLTAFGGIGKSCLANEYCHRVVSDSSCQSIVRWLSADNAERLELDLRQFCRLLEIGEANHLKLTDLIEKLNGKLSKLQEFYYFLFIFDNVKTFEDIEFVINGLPKSPKFKIIITTRVKTLTDRFKMLEVDAFNEKEAEEYVNGNLKKKANEKQMIKLINLVKTSDEAKVLPVKLSIIINYLNEIGFTANLNDMLNKIESEKIASNQVEDYLFDDLYKKSKDALKILAYGLFLDPSFISFNILRNLFKSSIESDLKLLQSFGLIEIVQENDKDGIRIQKLIQNEIKNFKDTHKTLINKTDGEIINKIVLKLIEHVPNVESKEESLNLETNSSDSLKFDYIQIKHILNVIKESQESLDKSKILQLKLKLANFYFFYENKYEKALDYFLQVHTDFSSFSQNNRQSLARLSLNSSKNNIDLAKLLNSIGMCYGNLIKNEKALEYFLKVIEQMQKSKKDSSDMAKYLNNVGATYGNLNDNKKALEYKLKAYEMRLRIYANNQDHADIADSLNSIGFTYSYIGDEKKSLEYKLKAFEMRSRIHKNSGEHADLAVSLKNIGNSYDILNDYNKALEYKLRAFEMQTKLFQGRDNADLADSLNSIGETYKNLNEKIKALEYIRKAYDMRCRIHNNEDHVDVARSLIYLGNYYTYQEEDSKALDYYNKAYEMRQRLFKFQDHVDIALTLNNIGISYGNLGDENKALTYYLQAYEMQTRIFQSNDHLDLSATLNNIGTSYGLLGEDSKALEYYMKSYAMQSRLYKQQDHKALARSLSNIGLAHTNLNEHTKALDYYLKAYNMRVKLYKSNENHPDVIKSLRTLISAYDKINDFKSSMACQAKLDQLNINQNDSSQSKIDFD